MLTFNSTLSSMQRSSRRIAENEINEKIYLCILNNGKNSILQHVFLSFNFTAQLYMAYIIIAAIPFVTVLFRIIQHSIFHHLLSLLFLSSVSSSTSFYISYVISNPYMLHHFIKMHTFLNFSTSLLLHHYELSLFLSTT